VTGVKRRKRTDYQNKAVKWIRYVIGKRQWHLAQFTRYNRDRNAYEICLPIPKFDPAYKNRQKRTQRLFNLLDILGLKYKIQEVPVWKYDGRNYVTSLDMLVITVKANP
jgi:hypothetical protein